MATAYTSLLGLALPVTGELSGTWGATVNDEITALLDSAVAGTTSITADADITLSDTDGAANETRQAVILWNPATGTTTRNITAPARSKAYIVINASGGTQSIVLRGAGPTTGVTIVKGEKALCAWDGSDFVKVANQNGIGNFTTVDTTNLEVTNLKALDGTAAGSIANSTGVVTLASSVLTTTDINGGTIDGTAIGGSTAAAGAFTTLSATGVTTVQAGTAAAPAITTTGDTNTGIFFPAADTIAFSEGGVESMRIDSSGNVGIGTSSPSEKLHVNSGAGNVPALFESTDPIAVVQFKDNNSTLFNAVGVQTNSLIFYSGDNINMRLDNSGNMGLGITPSALASGYKGFEINVVGNALTSSGSILNLSTNAIRGATFTYGVTSPASLYQQSSGTHNWYTAPSGTAGNTISFTQAMTLDSSGNLPVGTTTSTGRVAVQVAANGDPGVYFRNASGTNVGQIQVQSASTVYVTSSDYRLKENVTPMTGALAAVAALKPCTYTWKESGEASQGFIAHELQEVCPDAVTGEKDAVNEDGSIKPQGIDTSFLVATLTAAIQEQQAIIQTLTDRITALEGTTP